jgi:hypothetical protein
MELDPDAADDVLWSERVTGYDDYLNGQAVSFCGDRTKPTISHAFSALRDGETVFAARPDGGSDGEAA